MVNVRPPSRAEYYRVLAAELPRDTLVVTALGNASYLWASTREAPENFYLEDAMGLALPLAVGLALAQPARRVLVVEGDGGLLMHLGALVTVGAAVPRNLTVLVIQNGVHAASGGQRLTREDLDLAALAHSLKIERARNVGTAEELREALSDARTGDGPVFLALATEPDVAVSPPPRMFDPVVVKRRFMEAIGAPRYVPALFGGGHLEE